MSIKFNEIFLIDQKENNLKVNSSSFVNNKTTHPVYDQIINGISIIILSVGSH